MIPTLRLVILAAVPLSLAVAALLAPSVAAPMVALDVVLVMVAVLDALFARGTVHIERSCPPVQAVGRTFVVTLRVRNDGRRALRLRLTDEAPGVASGLPASLNLPAGREAEVSYEAVVHGRGEHAFGPVTVRWRSPLGLLERQVRLQIDDVIRVYPSFKQLRNWGVLAREDERRLPVRVRRRLGGENEFERLRPYVPGDSYRHIDWKATARRREYVTREYGQESNQNVIFLLDCGRMMSARSGDLTAFDHALNAALTMGQVALRHGDRVGLLVFDDKIRAWLPPKGGSRSGSRLIRGTYDIFPSMREPDYALAMRYVASRVRRRSLVVLMTAVVDNVNADTSAAIVRAMSTRHLPLCVWIRDSEVERLVTDERSGKVEHYQAGAAAELLAWRHRSLVDLQRKGALVVDVTPEQLTPRLLSSYLEIKARRLL
ncbi:MAG: hypothetical protein ACI9MC_001688 [Kiritimatiellia bacterium]